MNADEPGISRHVTELMRSFDESFAQSSARTEHDSIDLLLLRVGTETYAVRLSEIAGFYVGRKITGFPSPVPELLGVSALRAALIPVYDLGALLGCASSRTRGAFVLAKQAQLAFGVDAFEQHLRVYGEGVSQTADGRGNTGFVRELVRTKEAVHPILDLAALVSSVKTRAAHEPHPDKER